MGHHFLPKNLYLEPFIESKENPKIWVHEKGKEPNHRHWDYVASINDLHTIVKSSGEKDKSLESYLNQYELNLKPIVENVIQNIGDSQLSLEDRQKFAMFVGMMHVRTPRYFEQNKVLAKRLRDITDRAMKGDQEDFLEFLKETKTDAKDFFDSKRLEKISDWIKNPEIYDHFHLILLEGHALAIAKVIFEQMRWTFVVPDSDIEFITSDNPVSVCQITQESMRDAYAVAKNDSSIYFPISPKICFTCDHGGLIDRRRPSLTMSDERKYIENINLRTAAFAQKYAYSHLKIDLQDYFNTEDLTKES